MAASNEAVTFSAEQVQDLNRKLSDLRHNLNNHLALIISAAELIKRKPDVASRMADAILNPPQKIMEEMKTFSAEFERAFGINRD